MSDLKKQRIVIGVAVGLIILSTATYLFNSYIQDQFTRSKLLDGSLGEVIEHPETGLWTVSNELIIVGDLDLANRVAKRYRGVIVSHESQLEHYQIAFPVKDLDELNSIKQELENDGIETESSTAIVPF